MDSPMDVRLPLEVIQLIILYIPLTRLRLLCEEDDSLKSLIAPILYRNVGIGDFSDDPLFHNVTFLELNQLISGAIDVKIQHLKIDGDADFKKFWDAVRDSVEFFSKIPIIDFEGEFDKCWENLPNLRYLRINRDFLKYQIDAFPPNITSLTIDVKEGTNLPRLPKSLKHLRCYGKANLVFEFPPYLELFYKRRITHSDNLPQNLLKLETDDVNNVTLPDNLVELSIANAVDYPLTFPSGLKKLELKLSSIDTLVRMRFPCNLEALELHLDSVTTLDGVVFPSLLKELRLDTIGLRMLGAIGLESLDHFIFPDLKLLDISTYPCAIKSLSRVQFPKLERLIVPDQPVEDWSTTSLPDTLKELEIAVMEEPQKLKFPPHLKVLKIHFRDDLAEYSELQLPDTLEDLCLRGGISNIFEWNLPQLRSMEITSFSGPIKVPESVVDLSLRFKNYKLRDEIQIPLNVEKLEIPYPLEEYPSTITDLAIYDGDVRLSSLPPNVEKLGIPYPLEKYPATVTDLTIRCIYPKMESFLLPPNVERVDVHDGSLDGSLFAPPSSLNYFSGCFKEYLNTPSNWDTKTCSLWTGLNVVILIGMVLKSGTTLLRDVHCNPGARMTFNLLLLKV